MTDLRSPNKYKTKFEENNFCFDGVPSGRFFKNDFYVE